MVVNDILLQVKNIMGTNTYISATAVLIIFFIISKLVILIAEKISLKLASKTKTKVDDEIVDIINKPLSLIILLFGFKLFFLEIWKNMFFESYIDRTIVSIMAVIIIFTSIKIIDCIIQNWGMDWAKKTKSHLDDQLVRLVHQFSTILLYIIGFLWVLSIWGIKVGPLLAGLGIGGLAIAFALQPTLANIFGGVSLILDKTIKVGDIVKLDSGESGTVYDIGIRSTRVKTWNNEILILPNSKLVDSKVTNFNQPDRTIRVDIEFGVAYGSKIDKVKKLALDCLKKEKFVMKDPAPKIFFLNMGDSALLFKLMFYVDDLSNKWETHQSVIEKLYTSLNKNKVSIPFPQREIWVHNLKK